jgi:hypothetical protein
MREVQEFLGKPLLLEEFGKKLVDREYINGGIAAKRDPIFQAVYQNVEAAVAGCGAGARKIPVGRAE